MKEYKKGDIVIIKPKKYFLGLMKNEEIYTPSGLDIPEEMLVYCSTKQIICDVVMTVTKGRRYELENNNFVWDDDCFIAEKTPLFKFIDFSIKL